MRTVYAFSLLVILVSAFHIQEPLVISHQEAATDAGVRKVCVVRNVEKPSAVPFKESITLLEAIREAGGVSPDSKARQVTIHRRLAGSERILIVVDLKKLQKRGAKDLALEHNDIVDVGPQNKNERAIVSHVDCAACGCRLIPSVHRGFFIDYQ